MLLLHRYILREILLNAAAVTGVLAVILVSFSLSKVLDMAATNQLSGNVVWSLIGLRAVTELKVLLPIGLFLGILLALGRLYHESEMAAVQSCGMGARSLLRPIMAVTAIVVVVLCWLSFVVGPEVFNRERQIRMDAIRQARLANIAPQHFGSFAGGDVVYYPESIDDAGVLHHVFVQRRVGDKVEVTVASRAEQHGAGDVQQTFVLYDGQSYEGVPGSGVFRITRFAELGYPIKLPSFENWATHVRGKSSWQLFRSDDPAERSEFEQRLAGPLMALVLAIIAVPLSRLRPRQGRYAKLGFALLAYFAYQIGTVAAGTWMEKGRMPLFVGYWWVHAIAIVVAVWWVLRHDPLGKNGGMVAGGSR